jgi:hypothetical protein
MSACAGMMEDGETQTWQSLPFPARIEKLSFETGGSTLHDFSDFRNLEGRWR